ncbi:hypothetical protein MEX01_24770 [Methylorubrum extorquens]|jgi:hypothetical protein|nr:hypothetical protein MEX01_24770 [Methylorubrum extorquens]
MSAGFSPLKVAVVWRGDAQTRAESRPESSRFAAVFAALDRHGLAGEPAVWVDGEADVLRTQLMSMDAALAWVNPIAEDTGEGRGALDAVLREVAAAGILVSGHPDVIDRMGTKEVLVRTREMGWGSDTHLYASHAALTAGFPGRVAEGPRVLKRSRGNGGIGVWKVERAAGPNVLVQEARDRSLRTVPLDVFLAERAADFAVGGTLVDQPFQARHLEGMIRCYVSGTRVAGFGAQHVTALAPPEHGRAVAPLLRARGRTLPAPARPDGSEVDTRDGFTARVGAGRPAGRLGRRLPARAEGCRRRGHLRALRDQRELGVPHPRRGARRPRRDDAATFE